MRSLPRRRCEAHTRSWERFPPKSTSVHQRQSHRGCMRVPCSVHEAALQADSGVICQPAISGSLCVMHVSVGWGSLLAELA